MVYLRVGDAYVHYEGDDSWKVTLVPKDQASSWYSLFEARTAQREVKVLLKLGGTPADVALEGEPGPGVS